MFKKKRPCSIKRKEITTTSSSDSETPPIVVKKSNSKKHKTLNSTQSSHKIHSEPSQLHVSFSSSGTAASLSNTMATRQIDIDGVLETDLNATVEKPGDTEQILNGDDAERYQGLHAYKEYVAKATGIKQVFLFYFFIF